MSRLKNRTGEYDVSDFIRGLFHWRGGLWCEDPGPSNRMRCEEAKFASHDVSV